MAANALPPPPIQDKPGSFTWLEWYRQLRAYVSTSGSVPWYVINFAGSNITDIALRDHDSLQNIQGGTAGEHYHLTAAEHTALAGGAHNGLVGLQGGTTNEYYHLTQSKYNTVTTNLNLSGTSGTGIKIDLTTPTFGWHDLLGPIGVKGIGATDPIWTVYRGSIYAYTFDTATAECFITFHIPHDYVPGTDMFIHMHWSQNVVDTGGTAAAPGNIEWNFDISYADGHGTPGGAADPFIAPKTVTVVQQGSTTQYGHMIAEVQFTSNGGSATTIDRNTIQVDGLLLVRVWRTKANAADTLNQAPFGHTCDIHYQSSSLPTKNKSPNFYV